MTVQGQPLVAVGVGPFFSPWKRESVTIHEELRVLSDCELSLYKKTNVPLWRGEIARQQTTGMYRHEIYGAANWGSAVGRASFEFNLALVFAHGIAPRRRQRPDLLQQPGR